MAKKDLFDSIDVPEPCSQSWDAMRGDDKARFCASCEKDIHNLSAMTRGEIKKLLFQSKESVCVRLEKDTHGRVKTLKKQFHQITRQIPIAAGVLSASLAFASAADAQTKPPRPPIGKVKPPLIKSLDPQTTASISGTITDASGAVIPNAQVVLLNAKNKIIQKAKSNDDGFYEIKNIKADTYNLEIEARGFKKFVQQKIRFKADEKRELPIKLETDLVTLGILADVEILQISEPPDGKISDKIQTRQIESLPVSNRIPTFTLGLFPAAKPEKNETEIKKTKSKN